MISFIKISVTSNYPNRPETADLDCDHYCLCLAPYTNDSIITFMFVKNYHMINIHSHSDYKQFSVFENTTRFLEYIGTEYFHNNGDLRLVFVGGSNNFIMGDMPKFLRFLEVNESRIFYSYETLFHETELVYANWLLNEAFP